MHDVFTTQEVYGFTCLRCRHRWQEEYEVRRGRDAAGEDVVSYRVQGAPVPAPSGCCCPACGGYRIRLTPQRRCPHEVAEVADATPAVRSATVGVPLMGDAAL